MADTDIEIQNGLKETNGHLDRLEAGLSANSQRHEAKVQELTQAADAHKAEGDRLRKENEGLKAEREALVQGRARTLADIKATNHRLEELMRRYGIPLAAVLLLVGGLLAYSYPHPWGGSQPTQAAATQAPSAGFLKGAVALT